MLLVAVSAALFLYIAIANHQQQLLVSQINSSVTQAENPEQINQDKPLILARQALGELVVKQAVSRVSYVRGDFSPGWGNVEGCDMRNRILARDLNQLVVDEDNCTVISGELKSDPFTGESIKFERGVGTSGDIHIEHLVAVSDAWVKGAQELTDQERHQFYNDPLNLIAVDGMTNIAKGNQDASEWLPPPEYRCLYIARQIAVKLKYELWVSPREYQAMNQTLQTCPQQVLPIEKAKS